MDTFYNTKNLSIIRKKSLLEECHKHCRKWWVDILDCDKSMSRQSIEMSFKGILKKLKANSHFVVIDRQFHPLDICKHYEIGFSTMEAPSHFLWIWIEDSFMPNILKKYKLTPL